MHSIRFKITAITIGAILTAILCVFLASYSTIQTVADQRSVETMNLIGNDTQKSLEKYTEGIDQSGEMIGSIASELLDSKLLVEGGVAGTSAQSPEQVAAFESHLTEYCKELQKNFANIATHTHGIITYYYCINPDVSTTEHGFFYSNVGRAGFTEQEPLDARELDPNDLEHYTWYFTSIERGRPSWVGPYTAHFLNEMQICSYLTPIYKSGTLIGVLGMDIPVDTLIDQVRSIRVYKTGFACLLDDSGRVIYHPELPYGSVPDVSINSEQLKQKSSGDKLIRYTVNGQDRQMSFTTLSNGMKLAIVAPTDEVNESSIHLTRMILAIAVGIILVFTVIILLAMRLLTQPLLRLTAASKRLAAADYDVELDYKGHDEVGTLTNTFEQMRDQIQEDMLDLSRKANTDDLTGLPNQRHFFELANTEKQRLISANKRPAILYFNLIGMKHFNRQYGFDEGDELIRAFAQILSRQFGSSNTSRFGQDHFVAITDEETMIESIYQVFMAFKKANANMSLPVSVGIYQYSLGDVDVSVACDRAKYACDQRRGSYESGLRHFDTRMLEETNLARHVINNLDRALEEQWVKVYYQPIVRAVSGNVCDEEALSRWIDPIKGFLSPADFIPALENASLIYKLDLYVLEQVLKKMEAQQKLGFDVVAHSINLSRSDFDSCDIVEEICKRVDASTIPRNKITIEITESIVGSDFDFITEQVARFRSLGFPVWMDDFGSGYSSLDVLQSIEFDLLKFDMSFMRKFDEGDNGKIILTDLMKMANDLGIDTICEGVETEEQHRFLQEIGCSKLQGYYFCKPISLEAIVDRYRSNKQIGYENSSESNYFASLGKLNLYDPSIATSAGDEGWQKYLGTTPMAVLELRDGVVSVARYNKAYRELPPSLTFVDAMDKCEDGGEWVKVIEVLENNTTMHAFIRQLATNPVSGAKAYAIVVFSITGND